MKLTKNNIRRIVVVTGFSLALALLVAGCRNAGKWLVKKDLPESADALVMLMGSIPERVLQTADLYNEGRAGIVIIVEENMGSIEPLIARGFMMEQKSKQAVNALIHLGVSMDDILVLPGEAASTQMEAEVIRGYLNGTGSAIESLIIVSSSPHMRRATMIFKAALRSSEPPVQVYGCPSNYTEFNAEHWWRNREDIQQVILEHIKIANFILFEKRKLKS